MKIPEEVLDYIAQAPEQQQQIMKQLIDLIDREIPEASVSFKWSQPVFACGKDFAYFKTGKKEFTLGFSDRSKLTDTRQQLQGTGKALCHVKIKSPDELADFPLSLWLRQAAGIDR
ncbi:MAG: DUF1801 domain-containing protein [Bacteroidetes bacterium]|nr:DUF1801 domain-containing protein [Bacteroidota bacterium]MBK9292006.1 DUF1801 domain-containing protein [Bacteroidota bacterium]